MNFREYIEETQRLVDEEILGYPQEYEGMDWLDVLEKLYSCDSVTGCSSGSYYCNAGAAMEAVAEAIWDPEFLASFEVTWGADMTLAEGLEQGPEWMDTVVRTIALDYCVDPRVKGEDD
jgi:hypothetical protein